MEEKVKNQEVESLVPKVTRRKFLQILGAGAAVGVTGCADSAKQKVLPFVKGDEDLVPGVAVWYSSTCTECAAGCGIRVRTREGRAVKIEGNPEHPINRGGLCAMGQSAIQGLYDPDRVRQPLLAVGDLGEEKLTPVSWESAIKSVGGKLKGARGKAALLTRELTGTMRKLVDAWCSAHDVAHIEYDMLSPVAVAEASELCFGEFGVPEYHFDKADVVLNFGADFLETWVSPVGFARDWAKGRRAKHVSRVIHVEPRLSLTGANADLWLTAKPGSEVRLALAVLKGLLDEGRGAELGLGDLNRMRDLVKSISIADVAAETGIAREKILLVIDYLKESRSSLVLAGGTTAATGDAMPLLVAVNFLNLVLGNYGETVTLNRLRKPTSSFSRVASLVERMNHGEIDLLLVHGANPAYELPEHLGYQYAARKVKSVVSLSPELNETARSAKAVLPASTTLESWGDVAPVEGVTSLIQPVMSPVFDTKELGDILLGLAEASESLLSIGKVASYQELVRKEWEKKYSAQGAEDGASSFEIFWRQSLERGGLFKKGKERSRPTLRAGVFGMKFVGPTFSADGAHKTDPVIFPFPSVKSFDGRIANRPWLQELPDVMTKVVWDCWAEVNPQTAEERGIKQGDVVQLDNRYGQMNLPVYITEFVAPGVVAVPLGQGHAGFGRYADQVEGNVLKLLPPLKSKRGNYSPLFIARAGLKRGRGRGELVNTQGSDNQFNRGIGETLYMKEASHAADHDGEHGAEHGEDHGHHAPVKQMYEQRPHATYRWGMAVDLAACTGCSACIVACYAENNIPVVGKKVCEQGREMSWLRIERYYDRGPAEELQVSFVPMMCQQCGNAPCEPVCPVYATYHNDEGLNAMVYNRCVGTRYCSNNCSYKVRRFNWFEYDWPEPLNWQLNPDVMKRGVGVMEKCTFCVQRIAEGKDHAKDLGQKVEDGAIKPACVQSCPTEALVFGDLNDPHSKVSKAGKSSRAYKILDHHLNTQPSVTYLKDQKHSV